MAKKKKRKAAKAAKSKRPAARKAKKSKKTKKAVKTRKAAKRPAAKKAKRPAAKAKKRAAPRARKTRDVIGEGNYTAAREFRGDEEAFVRANRSRIPEMGKAAEQALKSPEGDALREAEQEARAHGRE